MGSCVFKIDLGGEVDVLNADCVSDDARWSIIASASTNSALAGVLAGFLLAAIAVLYSDSTREKHANTLALFFTGVVVLALDSYLFSHVTGIKPTDSGIGCARAWTQGIAASGMLVVGGVALTAGLGWMLAHYADQHSKRLVGVLGGVLTGSVVLVTTLLLVITTVQYLKAVIDPPAWLTLSAVVMALLPVALSGFEVTKRTLTVRARFSAPPLSTTLEAEPRWLGRAAIASAVLVVLAPVLSGLVPVMPADLPNRLWGIIPTLIVSVVLPGAITVMISKAVPRYI
ncbi:MAG: hypothetical protein PGN30_07600 [Mycolicibacterium neoaurum]|uniref:hypothetical protein n=1 Tax=Mycolicibacterium neoaurum TaxID=1795 RepID=UPI002FF48659